MAAPVTLVVGDVLVRDLEHLAVVSIRPTPDRGIAEVLLESRGYEVDIVAGVGPLHVGWIDEQYQDEVGDPSLLLLRHDYLDLGLAGHVLAFIGPITSAIVPIHARIDAAELWVRTDAVPPGGQALPVAWIAHRVLAPAVAGEATWNNASTHAQWAARGCGEVDVDYAATDLDSGSVVAEGWSSMLGGVDLGKILNADRTSAIAFIMRAIDGGMARLYSDLTTNTTLRPYLRIRYTKARV